MASSRKASVPQTEIDARRWAREDPLFEQALAFARSRGNLGLDEVRIAWEAECEAMNEEAGGYDE